LRRPSSKKFYKALERNKKKLDQSLFSSGVNAIFKFYEINKLEDLIVKSNEGVFTNKFHQSREEILKILHHEIFNSMKSCKKKMDELQEIEV